jgi:nitroimidazol reductase NimA-like FMN-containing flavoprotein (pyridoxamine 5'-phosphate oxidase superfamily)
MTDDARTNSSRRDAAGLKTPRTTPVRHAERGSHDWETIAAILDEGVFCHVGFVVDGQPYVVPTTYGREDRVLYVHGSSASRMLRTLSDGLPVCVTVSIIDGLVLARSAFKHSINYRSVMVLGTARPVSGDEKVAGLRAVTEHIARGRWEQIRGPAAKELKATSVLRLDITEASAKVRSGGPLDYEEDVDRDVWAGHLPLSLTPGTPIPHGRLPDGTVLPAYLAPYSRTRRER